MLARNRGFTLTELQLAIGLSSVLLSVYIAWTLQFVSKLQPAPENLAEQRAEYWLHWIWYDIQNEVEHLKDWQFNSEYQCLIYGGAGIKVKRSSIQWRPENSSCADNGWQALSDPSVVRFRTLELKELEEVKQLCLQYASPSKPRRREELCLPWPLA